MIDAYRIVKQEMPEVQRARELQPGLTISAFTRRGGFSRPTQGEQLEAALREAGLPE